MTGRRSLYIIAALVLLALLVNLAPPVLAWLRRDGPHFGLYDLRNPERVLPLADRASDGTYKATVTRFGLFRTTQTTSVLPVDRVPPPPIAVVETDPGQTATLPDGQQLRLHALKLLPPKQKGSPDILPAEQAYCGTDGKWMTKEEAVATNQLFSPGTDTVWWSAPGYSAIVDMVVLSNILEEDLRLEDFFDPRTGGSTLMGQSWSSRELGEPLDGFGRASTFSVPYVAVRPTPPAALFRVAQGPPSIVTLKPTAPQTFDWQGHVYTLRNISGFQGGKEVILVGEPKTNNQGSVYTPQATEFKLVFDELPAAMTSVRCFGKGGKQIPTSGSAGSERVFTGNADDVDRIEVRLRPDYAHVIFQLPDLPIIPEASRRTTDLMEMVLPPVVVSEPWEWNHLLGAIIQADCSNPGMGGGTPLSLPMDLGGKTVGEVVRMEHHRYPPHEVVLTTGSEGGIKARLQRGMTPKVSPRYLAVLFLAAILTALKLTMLLAAALLRRALRRRGYPELDIWQAEFLAVKLRAKAWKLPLHDDLATLPGVDIQDMASIVAFMRRSEQA